MSFTKATRGTSSLLVGIAGPSGAGKTYSALRLAKGLAGDRPIAVIDTERGRALHYADEFEFLHDELDAPFSPARYAAKIEEALRLEPAVIVVDSFSHEWAGEGGVLDMQQAEFERMGSRDAVKVASWIKPKEAHKRLISHVLLRLPCHLIVCLRAEDKIEIVDDPAKPGKKKIVAKETLAGHKGWIPVTGKELPYELTVSLVVTPDAPGVPKPIKLIEAHRDLVFTDVPLDEATGERLAAWAKGSGAVTPSAASGDSGAPSPPREPEGAHPPVEGSTPDGAPGDPPPLTAAQSARLDELVEALQLTGDQLYATAAVDRRVGKDTLVQLFGGQWAPLRDSLTDDEAASWIARLEAKVPAGAAA